ncbi:MAG: hypothetical protein FJW96_04570 [Actinobacteria bacterium]|nr:hypothetical protein [Actinomycetota bacterium]
MHNSFFRVRVVLVAALVALTAASAAFADRSVPRVFGGPGDTRSVDEAVQRGLLPIDTRASTARQSAVRVASRAVFRTLAEGDPAPEPEPAGPVLPKAGDSFLWLGLDDVQGGYALKFYVLRAIGEHAEVWVAEDILFQDGDCRNGERTTVTDQQVTYLLGEFDDNIHPKESAAFSVAPDRDGSKEALSGILASDPATAELAALVNPRGPATGRRSSSTTSATTTGTTATTPRGTRTSRGSSPAS